MTCSDVFIPTQPYLKHRSRTAKDQPEVSLPLKILLTRMQPDAPIEQLLSQSIFLGMWPAFALHGRVPGGKVKVEEEACIHRSVPFNAPFLQLFESVVAVRLESGA